MLRQAGPPESCLRASSFTLRLPGPLTHQLVNRLQSPALSPRHLSAQPMEPGRSAPRGCFRGSSLLACLLFCVSVLVPRAGGEVLSPLSLLQFRGEGRVCRPRWSGHHAAG